MCFGSVEPKSRTFYEHRASIMTQKIRLGLEWFLNPDHVPFLVGQQEGWFAEEGIELELIEPQEHLDAVARIASGELDMAVTEPLHLVEDRAEGKDVVGFARFLHTNGGVMYFENSGIKRPRDMAGKRLQYPGAPGPGGPAIVRTMIEADGGPKGATFEPVNHGFFHTDALIEGKADLATLAFYNFEVIEARQRGHGAKFFALKDWGVPDFCQLILITSPRTLEHRGEVVRAFLKVLSRGLDFVHQHPEEARAIYFACTKTEPDEPMMSAIFEATVPCFTFDFTMSQTYYEQLQTWLASHELITNTHDAMDAYWTNRFALQELA